MEESNNKIKSGGELVADVLVANGIDHVFTLCGGHISPILVSSKALGIKVVDVRHEANAAFAADAYARLTGRPGICAVTAGPGITNTITAVTNARLAESPLVILGGATATVLRGRGALQDIDQIALIRSNVKFATKVTSVKDVVPKLQKAISVAVSGVQGPVFVELPLDVLYPKDIVKPLYGVKEKHEVKSTNDWIFNSYLKWRLNKLFRPNKTSIRPVSASYPKVKPSSQIVNLVRESKRPVLVVGSQALHDVSVVKDLADSIKKLGIPTYLSGMARGLLGKGNEIQMRHKRRKALREADLVILSGVPMDFRLDYGRQFGRKTEVVNLNLDPKQLKLNTMLKPVRHRLLTSPSHYVIALQQAVGSHSSPEWMSSLRNRDDLRNEEITKLSEEEPEKYLNPLYVVRVIEEHLDEDSMIIGDGGDFLGSASYVLSPRKPLSWLDPGAFGTLGPGAGFAMASKLIRPDSEVWIIYGDGSAGYSLMEIDTMVRHGLPVIIVIGNDGAWAQIAREQVEFFDDAVATELGHANYEMIAGAFGAEGIKVETKEELEPAVKRAKSIARGGKPVILNVLLGKSDFRKGSISV